MVSLHLGLLPSPPNDLLDRVHLESQLSVEYAAALTIDSIRHIPRTVGPGGHVPLIARSRCDYHTVACSWTLRNWQTHVQNLYYFSALSAEKHDPMRYLFSKVLNQRCQARKFSSVAMDEIKLHPAVTSHFRQFVLVSLLGNYPHSTTKTRVGTRYRLYEMLQDSLHRFEGWFTALLNHCPILVIQALRDYLVFAIRNDPVLETRLSDLLHLDRFAGVVEESWVLIRDYFDRNLGEPLASLCRGLEPENRQDTMRAFEDINRLMAPIRQQILKTSYKRMHGTMTQKLGAMRRTVPCVREKKAPKEKGVVTEAQIEALGMSKELREMLAEAKEEEEEPAHLALGLTEGQFDALSFLVARLQPTQPGILSRLAPWLVYFGVPRDQCARLRWLLDLYQHGTLDLASLVRDMKRVRQWNPHAYNLLQGCVECMHALRQRIVVLDLPAHYRENQLEAAKAAFGLDQTPYVLDSSIQCVLCPICNTVYTPLRDFESLTRPTKKRKHEPLAKFRPPYEYGLRRALVDHFTGEVYCRNHKRREGVSCGDEPLLRIPLLGKMLKIQQKLIILCPQRSCGFATVLDPNECMVNERGPSCLNCTIRHRRQSVAEFEQRLAELSTRETNCVLCAKPLPTNPQLLHLYPHGVVLCRFHNHKRLVSFLEGQIKEKGEPTTREQLVEWMVRERKDSQKEARDRESPYIKRQLAVHKSRSRSARRER